MNKAISTALLLAAGTALANAASVYENITSTASDNLVAAWNFEAGASASTNSWTWGGDSFGYTQGDDYGTIGSTGRRPYITNISGIQSDSFTISFDVRNVEMNTWTSLISLYTDNEVSGDGHSMQLQSSSGLTLYSGNIGGNTTVFGNANSSPSLSAGSVPTGDAWTTITITSGDETLSVYVDGVLTDSGSFDPSGALTGLQFGAAFGSGRQITSADIDNVAIWNTALEADQVAALVALPEPSAFGLLAGLGALALVAARRRRGRKA